MRLKLAFLICFATTLLCQVVPAATRASHSSEAHTEPQSGSRSEPRHLEYRFDLSEPARIHVSLETSSPPTGGELLDLPSRWADSNDLDQAIDNLKITGSAVALEPTAQRSRFTLRAKPGTTITLRYDLVQGWTGAFSASERHRVLLRPGLIEFNGENGLVAPHMDPGAPVQVSFSFQHLLPGEALATSFGTEPEQSMSGPWSRVKEALFVAGAFRLRTITSQGSPVLLAIAGGWSFSDQEFALKAQRILSTERQFWQKSPATRYLVVVAPFDTGLSGGGGSAFTDAFSLFLAPAESFGEESESLFAHEAFHAWNPGALGRVVDYQSIAWFSEGFTTYYQDLLLHRARLIDVQALLKRRNMLLRDYQFLASHESLQASDGELKAESGVRDQLPREQSARDQIEPDGAAYREPYLRGAMIALWLNAEILRQRRGPARESLDNLMRALKADAQTPLTEERIATAAAFFVDASTVARLHSLISTRMPVTLSPDSLGPCTLLRSEPMWSYDPGIPSAQLRKGSVLHGLDPDGPAFHAGLRDGQTVVGWSLWRGDAEREAVLTVRQPDGSLFQARYLPRGHQMLVQQGFASTGCTPPAETVSDE